VQQGSWQSNVHELVQCAGQFKLSFKVLDVGGDREIGSSCRVVEAFFRCIAAWLLVSILLIASTTSDWVSGWERDESLS